MIYKERCLRIIAVSVVPLHQLRIVWQNHTQ